MITEVEQHEERNVIRSESVHFDYDDDILNTLADSTGPSSSSTDTNVIYSNDKQCLVPKRSSYIYADPFYTTHNLKQRET